MIDRRHFIVLASGTAAATTVLGRARFHANASRVRVVGLKVDHIDRPLGIENPRPRLSWRLESRERNVRQHAYRILVASNEQALLVGQADIWVSGVVESPKCFDVLYEGRSLTSRERYWWRVEAWDERSEASVLSAPSWWEMGLLQSGDWTGDWLAVEDTLMKGDREAGLNWIWGPESDALDSRGFRLEFTLPAKAPTGELCVVGAAKSIGGVWLDGKYLGSDASGNPPGLRVTTPPLAPGRHVLAIRADASAKHFQLPRNVAIAALVRFQLDTGEVVRFATGSACKTTLVSGDSWTTPHYDEFAWEDARPLQDGNHQAWPPLPAMHLRRRFRVDKVVAQARLYATALGAYEARLNGKRVGDALLTPEPSQYDEQVLYQIYDVTSLLQAGENILGFTVADGWYASFDGRFAWGPPPRRVRGQLEIAFTDGSQQSVSTDGGWKIAQSPIVESQMRIGEVYDARLEKPGWDKVHYDDNDWDEVASAEAPSCRLIAQVSPPIRATQILTPQSITDIGSGRYVVDFGQTFAGWCRLRAKGDAGHAIELRFAELLTPSGEMDQESMGITIDLRDGKRRDIFIMDGGGKQVFEPRFSYTGFRYVEISGLTEAPCHDDVEGVVVHSDLVITSAFRSSAPLLNQIWATTVWTQRSNFVGIVTDSPGREQRGWAGDPGIFWGAGSWIMDLNTYTARLVDVWVSGQSPEGALPTVAPNPAQGLGFNVNGATPGWSDAAITLIWTVWRRYGTLSLAEKYWDALNRYVGFVEAANPNHLWINKRGIDVGDHLAPDDDMSNHKTPKDLFATACWAHSARLMADLAEALGRDQDAKRLRQLFDNIREAFNEAHVLRDGTIGSGSQACYVLALAYGLLPQAAQNAARERLVSDLRERRGALTTGIVSTPYLPDVLADSGFADMAYDLLFRTEYPSWGHMLRHGATTIWENWTGQFAYSGAVMRDISRNQPALGAVCDFLFRRVAGIDLGAPGFERIVIRPTLDPRIKLGGGDYDSVMGRISTDWQQHADGVFSLKVTIPANASARVHLPAPSSARIREGRCDVTHCRDLRLIDRSDREIVLEVGAGSYSFTVSA